MDKRDVLRNLPSVGRLLEDPALRELLNRYPRPIVVEAVREEVESLRQGILTSDVGDLDSFGEDVETLLRRIALRVKDRSKMSLRSVINATGVIVHTNLGRSPLSDAAISHVVSIAGGYSNLEFDLRAGARSSRYIHVEDLLCELTGAEAAMIVNNNAAAVLLALNTLAEGREVIVSRGELIEIGGAFRMPDVIAKSGARLVEVGTTNKTRLGDYEAAVNESTSALLKVHTSNYRIVGFTEEVALPSLVALGRRIGLPVLQDLGSGVFVDLSKYGADPEPTVSESVSQGADVVTFSGDKLLGGPQGGLIVGRKGYIEAMRKNPLTRAVRVDKMTLAALEATLRLYRDENWAVREIPTLRMIAESALSLKKKARLLARGLRRALGDGASVEVVDDFSQVGGGALPLTKLPTKAVAVALPNMSANELDGALRNCDPPIVARISRGRLIMDARTIGAGDMKTIIRALKDISKGVDDGDKNIGRG
ncbi:MAG: L-seryl-tRNA(Sec) selenium transferase [bacterium]